MDGARAFDAIVIGAGIVGAGTAFALARRRRKVALVDAGASRAAGTSGASFAWINATAKTEAEDYHRLNVAGVERWHALAREFGAERLGFCPTGMIAWANGDDPARRDALRRQVAQLREWGVSPVMALDEAGLREHEPRVMFSPGAEGLVAERDAWLDVPRAVEVLYEVVRRAGGEVRFGAPVRALMRDEAGAVCGVELDGERLQAPAVVVATGAEVERSLRAWLRPEEGPTHPFLGERPGLLVDTPPGSREEDARLVRHVLYTGDNALHVRHGMAGEIRIGSEDLDPEAGAPEEELVTRTRALVRRACAIVPGLQTLGGASSSDELAAMCRMRVGVRPVPVDDRSALGPVAGVPGLFVGVTHSGVTLGLHLGELLAGWIDTGERPEEAAPFRFDRFV